MNEQEKMKWSVRVIAAVRKTSIEQLAEDAGIDASHLKQVSAGNIRMLADDLYKLCKLTGLKMEEVQIV